MHCGASVRELYGALAFHSITFSHLQAPHINLIPSFPTFNTCICLWNWRREVPGEEIGYQMYASVH